MPLRPPTGLLENLMRERPIAVRGGGHVAPLVGAVLGLVAAGCLSPAASHEETDPGPRPPVITRIEPGPPAWVRVRVTDEEGRVVPAVIRAVRPGGTPHQLGGNDVDGEPVIRQLAEVGRWHRGSGWVTPRGEVVLGVPAAPLVLEAFAGLETELTRLQVRAPLGDTLDVELPLVRFADPRTRGWYGANTHLHLRDLSRADAIRYLDAVARSNRLDLVFLSHLHRAGHDYVSNDLSADDLAALTGHGVRFSLGSEHRHNLGPQREGYGHVLVLGLDRAFHPLSLGPALTGSGTDGTPLRTVILDAGNAGATTIWAHNEYGLEHLVSWVLGGLDALNLFDGLNRGGYLAPFYRLLDAGFRVPISTGTDWFVGDCSRVYAQLDEDARSRIDPERGPDPADWLRALAAGRSYITNGPLLEFTLDDAGPGATHALDAPAPVTIRGRADSREPFFAIELVRDGELVASAVSSVEGGHHVAVIDTVVTVERSGWFALRVRGGTRTVFSTPLFGHTSAIHVEVGGAPVFVPEAARMLLETLRAYRPDPDRGTFAGVAELAEVRHVYDLAADTLAARLDRWSGR